MEIQAGYGDTIYALIFVGLYFCKVVGLLENLSSWIFF